MAFPPRREQGSPPDSQRSSSGSGRATRARACSSRKELGGPSEVVSGQTTEGLPVAPSLGPSLSEARVPPERALVDGRVVYICVLSIGTGGPFGAEGPIIATGGAVGSLVGQLLHTTAVERKVLLACGAAAGMSATFNTPIAGVILAIELLLFEFKSRSF